MTRFISISIAADLLGVSTKTLRRWDREKLFQLEFRTVGHHRRYELQAIMDFKQQYIKKIRSSFTDTKKPLRLRAVLYSRVSTTKQKKRGDLQRQEDSLRSYCEKNGFQVVKALRDVGSRVNDNRKGLHQVINLASQGTCYLILVTYPDRLARFGVTALKKCFSRWNVSLHVVGKTLTEVSREAELVNDITGILYSYMGKLYRMRRRKKWKYEFSRRLQYLYIVHEERITNGTCNCSWKLSSSK